MQSANYSSGRLGATIHHPSPLSMSMAAADRDACITDPPALLHRYEIAERDNSIDTSANAPGMAINIDNTSSTTIFEGVIDSCGETPPYDNDDNVESERSKPFRYDNRGVTLSMLATRHRVWPSSMPEEREWARRKSRSNIANALVGDIDPPSAIARIFIDALPIRSAPATHRDFTSKRS